MSGIQNQIGVHRCQAAQRAFQRFEIAAEEIVATEGVGKQGISRQQRVARAVAYGTARMSGGVDDLNKGVAQRNAVAVMQ